MNSIFPEELSHPNPSLDLHVTTQANVDGEQDETPDKYVASLPQGSVSLENGGNPRDARLFRSDPHHPLTLLSFLSKTGDEPSSMPVGKRPNRSLPSILYRPRRLIEIEATAAEKAKKEQLDKVLFHLDLSRRILWSSS